MFVKAGLSQSATETCFHTEAREATMWCAVLSVKNCISYSKAWRPSNLASCYSFGVVTALDQGARIFV